MEYHTCDTADYRSVISYHALMSCRRMKRAGNVFNLNSVKSQVFMTIVASFTCKNNAKTEAHPPEASAGIVVNQDVKNIGVGLSGVEKATRSSINALGSFNLTRCWFVSFIFFLG